MIVFAARTLRCTREHACARLDWFSSRTWT